MLWASRRKQQSSFSLSKAEAGMVVRIRKQLRKLVFRLTGGPNAQECLSSSSSRRVSSSVNNARKPRSDFLHEANLAHALYLDYGLSTL